MKHLKLFEGYNRIDYKFGKGKSNSYPSLVDEIEMIASAVATRLPLGGLSGDSYCHESLINEIKLYVGDSKIDNPLDVINKIIQDEKYMCDLYDTIATSAASDKVMSMEEVLALPVK